MSADERKELRRLLQAGLGRAIRRDQAFFVFFRILPEEGHRILMGVPPEESFQPASPLFRPEMQKGEDFTLLDVPPEHSNQRASPLFRRFLRHLGERGAAPEAGESGSEQGEEGAEPDVEIWPLAQAIRQFVYRHDSEDRPLMLRESQLRPGTDGDNYDRTAPEALRSVNIGFTYAGLRAAGVHPLTLQSFPEAFRQGQARRSERLGDTGDSAAGSWDGWLGTDRVHGLLILSEAEPSQAIDDRRRIRRAVARFNAAEPRIRQVLSRLFARLGIEALHIEYGEQPYFVHLENGKQTVVRAPWPVEHFGFADAISQPMVDLGFGPHSVGGGTPEPDGRWSPLAPGEFYLDFPDEDGTTALTPANRILRRGGTYVVFRKLAQDVGGFRSFLKAKRPDMAARNRLAAQMVGRWKNGLSLMRHPDGPVDRSGDAGTRINDFRYLAEDPDGQRCPIGAHVRRTNPRDIGFRAPARRHRLLRRGVAYGGAIMPDPDDDELRRRTAEVKGVAPDRLTGDGDGNERGVLFLALNARIEHQFELVQRDWINAGAIAGQAGAGRCPVSGANGGTARDAFLEAGSLAPVTNLPRFVGTRGGEYLFAPSVDALTALGKEPDGETHWFFPPEDGQTNEPRNDALAETPGLLSASKLADYMRRIIFPLDKGRRARFFDETLTGPNGAQERFVFIGRYDDVAEVLGGVRVDGTASRSTGNFASEHYREHGRRLTRGADLYIGLEPGDWKRDLIADLLKQAAATLNWPPDPRQNVQLVRLVQDRVDTIVREVSDTGRIDIVQELAYDVPYRVCAKLFGVTGPDALSDIVIASIFNRDGVTDVPRDWFAQHESAEVRDPAYVSMQAWSRLLFAEVGGDILRRESLIEMAAQAASAMLDRIDNLMDDARREMQRQQQAGAMVQPANLLDAFVHLEKRYVGNPFQRRQVGSELYREVARTLLAELSSALCINVGAPFARIVEGALQAPQPLIKRFAGSGLPPAAVEQFAEEMLRLNPVAPLLFRRCVRGLAMPDLVGDPGADRLRIMKGDYVCVLMSAVNRDSDAFSDPNQFDPGRPLDRYLTFGLKGGPHRCWGEALGRLILVEMLKGTARFTNLRPAAGADGDLVLAIGMPRSMHLRFSPFDPDDGDKVRIRGT